MNKQIGDISLLLQLYLKGELNDAQSRELDAWLNASEENREILESLSGNNLHDGLREIAAINTAQAREKIPGAIFLNKEQNTVTRKMYTWWWAAAAILLVLSLSTLWLLKEPQNKRTIAKLNQDSTKAKQGPQGPVLTLSDGTVIALGEAGNGTLAEQGGAKVVKLANGQIAYEASNASDAPVSFNTIAIPRGMKYNITLPDGSKVWLNAASSLRYPTAFKGDREVTLTGEAYFEIARDPAKPFNVNVNGMQVQVLGTGFNIMAYDNEAAVATTLLEGAVAVNSNGKRMQLKPGEQALLGKDGQMTLKQDVNTQQVVAWKSDYLQFNNDRLDYVMRQIERWYDVSVRYEGGVPQRKFGGKIPRNNSLADVVKALELSKVNCRLEGSTIIVTNN